MAIAMERVARDGELAARLGKAGRKRVEKEYSWERFFSEFDKYLRMTSNV
jgi:glycosyltransferase involved in cell wall biosynthesis